MPKPPKPEKTLPQRLTEVVEVLMNLKNAGISDQDPGFQELKGICDKFVKEGESFTGKVDFPRYGRYADVILTNWAGRKNTVVLRATQELKDLMERKGDA
jgi:hypothetical protein